MPLSATDLRHALARPLPGHDAFADLSGYPRPSIAQALKQDPPPRESAVLILVYPVDGADHTLLMRRPVYQGIHSGQIAFPGGKREAVDKDLQDTALREFQEETGADNRQFEVVGQLSRIHIPPSRTIVTPVVAWAPWLPPVQPDPREVAALIDVPMHEILRNDILRNKEFRMGEDGALRNAPYWAIRGEVVWGATAMMIAEFRTVLGHPLPPRPEAG